MSLLLAHWGRGAAARDLQFPRVDVGGEPSPVQTQCRMLFAVLRDPVELRCEDAIFSPAWFCLGSSQPVLQAAIKRFVVELFE